MDKAREILEQMPDVKIGLDSFYGQQTVLNALNKALNIHNVVERSEQLVCSCGRNHLDGEIKRNECAVCWLEVKAN